MRVKMSKQSPLAPTASPTIIQIVGRPGTGSLPSTITLIDHPAGGLKLISININSIMGKTLDLMAFHEVHQPHVVAILETKIDSAVTSSK